MRLRLRSSASLSPILLMAALLSACAAEKPSTTVGLRAAQADPLPAEEVAAPAQSSSAFGLYLAGEAAIDGGSSHDAARYFGQASTLEGGTGPIQARAFSSALVSGEVGKAAAAAEGLGDGDDPLQRLGRLTRAVEALANDHGKEALALLSVKSDHTAAHDQAIQLLRPWAAGEAGDIKAATQPPAFVGDPVDQGVAELGRAELLEHAGRFTEAEAAYKTRAVGKDGLFILAYGGFLERRGRQAEALKAYDQALVLNGSDFGIKNAKARAAAGRPAPALPSYREGAAEALIGPAAMMLAKHEGDSGLAYLRLALRLDPTLDEAWVLVGDAMNSAGDLASAKEAYGKVRPRSDQYIAAKSRLALMAQQAGQKEDALRLAREILDVAPTDPRALVLYADLLRDDERFPEAVQVLNRAIGSMTADEVGWALYYERGVAEERAGDWTSAEADLQKALKLKPNEPQVLNYLGYAWADRGQHLKEAMAMLQMAASLEPRSGAIVDSLGWARYRNGQYKDAMRDLEHAVTLDPADPEVNSHLGDVYWRMGRQLEARFQWKRVLTLSPDPKTKAAVELKLAQGLGPESAISGPGAISKP